MTETKAKLKIRKAPKFLPFLLAGGAIGLIAAFILNGFSTAEQTGAESILGFLIGWMTALGAAVGIVIALLLDWLLRRSSKEVEATKLKQ